MLSEQVIEQLVEVLVRRIEKVNTYTLKKIGEVLKEIKDIPPARAYDLAMILKYGGDYDKIVKELAKVTDLNEKEIEKIFKEVAKKNLAFSKQFYDYRKKKYIPFEKNIELQNQVKAIAKITQDTYRNMSNTLGFAITKNNKLVYTPLAQVYQDTIDEGVTALIQGKDSFNSAVTKTIRELSKSGLRTIEWESGYHRRLDSSVRMNLQGALRDFSINLQRQFGEEYGADGVEISVHDYPAPDHADVQGHQFSNEEFDKFQNDLDSRDYKGNFFSSTYGKHDRRSIGEYNCYHYVYNVVLGVSKPQYSDKQLKKILNENEKGFDYEGKHYTMYEGTQLQRKLETAIRKQKDRQIMASVAEDDDEFLLAQQKTTQLTNKYFELSKKSGLKTKVERLDMSRKSITYKPVKEDLDDVVLEERTEDVLEIKSRNISNYKKAIEKGYWKGELKTSTINTEEWLGEKKNNNNYVIKHNIGDEFTYKDEKFTIDNDKIVIDYKFGEEEYANKLSLLTDKEIEMYPRFNEPKYRRSADYRIGDELFDFKYIKSGYDEAMRDNIKVAKGQSDNFIVALTNKYITKDEMLYQVETTFRRENWVKKNRSFL